MKVNANAIPTSQLNMLNVNHLTNSHTNPASTATPTHAVPTQQPVPSSETMKELTEETEKLKKQLEDADDLIKTLVKFVQQPWSNLMNTLNGEHLEASNPPPSTFPRPTRGSPPMSAFLPRRTLVAPLT